MKRHLLYPLLLFGTLRGAAMRPVDRLPSDASLVKQTIINVLRMAPTCKTRDAVQLSIQPLLFTLERSSSPETDTVLQDLLSYDVGEANAEILRCIVIRRGVSYPAFAETLALPHSNDCRLQIGAGSDLCRTDGDVKERRQRLRKAIADREACDLEY